VKPAKVLIKENNEITHNSIFADFTIPDLHVVCAVFEIRNQTVKDQPFRSRTRQNPALHDQPITAKGELSSNELEKNIQHQLNPLLRGTHNIRECGFPSNGILHQTIEFLSWDIGSHQAIVINRATSTRKGAQHVNVPTACSKDPTPQIWSPTFV
jgi:hypothetical protein